MTPDDRRRGRAKGPPDEAGLPPADSIVELCAFRVGAEEYVVDIRRIREVIRPLPVRPVPRAPDFVEGVANLRGEVIPVVDVRRRFGLPASPHTRTSRYLVAHVAGRVLALVVDAVLEVVRIPRSSLRPAPPSPAGAPPRLFLGACGGEPGSGAPGRDGPARLRLLLNVKALLQPMGPEEMAAAREAAGGGEGAP